MLGKFGETQKNAICILLSPYPRMKDHLHCCGASAFSLGYIQYMG